MDGLPFMPNANWVLDKFTMVADLLDIQSPVRLIDRLGSLPVKDDLHSLGKRCCTVHLTPAVDMHGPSIMESYCHRAKPLQPCSILSTLQHQSSRSPMTL